MSQDRGDTLYVGAKASDVLGRLYNKDKESQDAAYKDCWRWEIQQRRGYALSAVRSLLSSPDPSQTVVATVSSWFRARGVAAEYRTTVRPLAIGMARKTPDDLRRLAWLRRCVRPMAQELAKRYGWRYVAETLLGRIGTLEEWETLVQGIEIELVEKR